MKDHRRVQIVTQRPRSTNLWRRSKVEANATNFPERNNILPNSRSNPSASATDLIRRDFAAMPLDDLDRYLDRCETVLLRDHNQDPTTSPFPLLPTSNLEATPIASTWEDIHQSAARLPVNDDASALEVALESLESGAQYTSYDARDYTGTLPDAYETLLMSASDLVGVSKWEIADVVELFDRRLLKVSRRRNSARSRSASRSVSRSRSRGEGGTRSRSRTQFRAASAPDAGNLREEEVGDHSNAKTTRNDAASRGRSRSQSRSFAARDGRSKNGSASRSTSQSRQTRIERSNEIRERLQLASSTAAGA